MFVDTNVSNPPFSGVSDAISWPVSRAFRPLTLKHNGSEYRVRIFQCGRRYTAMAKVRGRLVDSVEASSEMTALAHLIKRLDPAAGTIRDRDGKVLAE